jgi:hypothetical protein
LETPKEIRPPKQTVQIRTDKHSSINIGRFSISAIYKFVKTSKLLAENLLKLEEVRLGTKQKKRHGAYESKLKSNQRCKGH